MSDTQKVSVTPRRATRTCEQTGPLSIREVRALPAAVDLVTAGRALNIGRSLAYELAATGQFPIPVLTLGRARRCMKADLLERLGLPVDDSTT